MGHSFGRAFLVSIRNFLSSSVSSGIGNTLVVSSRHRRDRPRLIAQQRLSLRVRHDASSEISRKRTLPSELRPER